jgi:hypothetical protein
MYGSPKLQEIRCNIPMTVNTSFEQGRTAAFTKSFNAETPLNQLLAEFQIAFAYCVG